MAGQEAGDGELVVRDSGSGRGSGNALGYTLVELAVVVSILGVLLLVAMASYRFSAERSFRVVCRGTQRVFSQAVASYETAHDEYPSEISDLRDFINGYDSAVACPKDGRSLVYDPVRHDVTCVNHPAW